MKFEFNRKYTTIAVYVLAVLAAAMLLFVALQNIGPFLERVVETIGFVQPFVYGLVFAFLLNPLLRFFEDRLLPQISSRSLKPSHSRAIAILMTYLVAFTMFALFIALVVPQIITSVIGLLENISVYVDMLEDLYDQAMSYIRSIEQGSAVEALFGTFLARLVDSLDSMLDGAGDTVTALVGHLLSATQYITTAVFNMLIGVIASIYLLASREKLLAQLNKITRALCPERTYRLVCDIAQDSNRILSGFVVGRIIDALLVGILCFIGMSILRLPYPVFISVIVGVTNVIPFFGPFLGAIPSFIIIYVESPVQALWFAIFILLLQQFDGNYMGPKIVGDSIGLPAVWVLFSILLFGGLWGWVGMFVGVPIFAIICSLVKRVVNFLLERKGASTKTADYDSDKNPLG